MNVDRPVTLQAFRHDLLDDLVTLWRASFEAAVGITDPNPIDDQVLYFLNEVLAKYQVRLALCDGQLVGFIAASNDFVAQLFVRVGQQRRGIGTQMLDWAKSRSAGTLWLYTFARNTGARAFYERSGFTPVEHGFEATWQLEDVKYRWAGAAT